MQDLIYLAAKHASATAVNAGLALLAAVGLVAFTWLSARVRWWHVLAISVAVILLDGTLDLFSHLMAMLSNVGDHVTITTKR